MRLLHLLLHTRACTHSHAQTLPSGSKPGNVGVGFPASSFQVVAGCFAFVEFSKTVRGSADFSLGGEGRGGEGTAGEGAGRGRREQ